jgi:hypothetical protein
MRIMLDVAVCSKSQAPRMRIMLDVAVCSKSQAHNVKSSAIGVRITSVCSKSQAHNVKSSAIGVSVLKIWQCSTQYYLIVPRSGPESAQKRA